MWKYDNRKWKTDFKKLERNLENGKVLILVVIYTLIINNLGFNYSYLKITYITVLLSILSWLGDLIASCIKRYIDIKDFDNLIPGHDVVLDRIWC